jgi:hypothetical protein
VLSGSAQSDGQDGHMDEIKAGGKRRWISMELKKRICSRRDSGINCIQR